MRIWPELGGPVRLARRQLAEAVHAALAAGEELDDVAAAALLPTREVRRLAREGAGLSAPASPRARPHA